jgi:hypothetical protein
VVVGESELVHAEIGVNAPEIGVVCSEIEVFTFEIGGVSAHRGVVRGEIGVISAKKCPTTCHPDRSDGRHVLSSRAKARSAAVEGSARLRGRSADPLRLPLAPFGVAQGRRSAPLTAFGVGRDDISHPRSATAAVVPCAVRSR